MEHQRKGKNAEYLQGIIVLVVLAVFTAIEYAIGTADELPLFSSAFIPLTLIALIKAGVIVNYYMHISHMWNPEEEEHEAHGE
ncbi:MAG: cytochrome C oxidase subunit IV family protein [Chloroflexi bacterium]|nr:cytochrome C oxidase subunit IV family protein [Chloroflexota bacterium]